MGWTESLAIGVAAIDAQHRELFRQVARLDEDLLAGDRLAVGAALGFLRDYALEHFEAEERLMREARYPGYLAHKRRHDGFVERVLALCREYDAHGTSAILELRIQNWIEHWLEVHVAEEDALLGRHLRAPAA